MSWETSCSPVSLIFFFYCSEGAIPTDDVCIFALFFGHSEAAGAIGRIATIATLGKLIAISTIRKVDTIGSLGYLWSCWMTESPASSSEEAGFQPSGLLCGLALITQRRQTASTNSTG